MSALGPSGAGVGYQKGAAPKGLAMIRRLIEGSALYALLWTLLTGGAPASWVVGGPAVLLAAGLGAGLAPQGGARMRWTGTVAFVPFFLGQSLRGGWDVARRALHPALPLRPGRMGYRCGLPRGPARTFFANVVSLLPGTLFLEDRGEEVWLHVVDTESPVAGELADLEARVARLFGIQGEGG